jgi:4-amino-4-deoxy-L-arabinose transferase-like glycosyltransferase
MQPIPSYIAAGWLRMSGLSPETSGRVPGVVASVIDVLLMWVLATRLVGRTAAAVAAVMLALTPSHFFHGRLVLDSMATLLFLMGWLAGMLAYADRPRRSTLFAATLCLGVCTFTTPQAVWTTPLYALISAVMIWVVARDDAPRHALVGAAGLMLPLAALIPWFLRHPLSYAGTIGAWGIHAANLRAPLDGIRQFFGYHVVGSRATLYWDSFSPRYLAMTGGSSSVDGTQKAGVFLWPVVVLAVIGAQRSLRHHSRQLAVIGAGVLAAPIGMVMLGHRQVAAEELTLLPFVIVLAAVGVDSARGSTNRLFKLVVIALLAVMPIQFAYYAADYFGDYRVRSSRDFARQRADGC